MNDKLVYFIQQVRQREGEHEQSLLRVFFALPIFIYLFIEFYFITPTSVGVPVFVFSAVWFACAILLVFYYPEQTQHLQKKTMAGNVCRHYRRKSWHVDDG